MPNLFLVMLGGAIGAGFRYHLSRVALEQMGAAFPWGTWIANLLGGLLMGLLAGIALRDGPVDDPLLLFLGVGMLGGFTTFSAFSLEAAQMIQRGELIVAAAYAVSSVAGSVMLLFIGFWLARATA
ncbi:fluoride efflux transporter CrcB [Enterovirga sp. GCM10030262]|uniref:fluoride efflux transporter CrcB n=1 Tax=Enterovirga sp. GCM10030262 TaxID=3273391 RepID=UPI0036117554